MSDVIDKAVERLAVRLPEGFETTAKFVIAGEGAIMVDAQGVRAGDEPAAVTLSADTATFRGMLEGRVNPMTAFMTGKLKVEGPMTLAMKLGKAMA
ncbi:SCP2 sterol-binding domain-containing protein [Paenirhodobacter enshiensis]|uniref:Sterol carrier family protein n=1 Tax=Paenirhodobacter enshiensis TaxID=1105367 RepID=A0A086XRY8_9RHOB|nr:SCP2 sterol-binding domain-containing protein [Paenirhodobacter enshiensis]KFI24788.1 sterol carrier family protein [Paenirhodobacter enshiensis]